VLGILEIVVNFVEITYTLYVDLIEILNVYQVNVRSISYFYEIQYNFQNFEHISNVNYSLSFYALHMHQHF